MLDVLTIIRVSLEKSRMLCLMEQTARELLAIVFVKFQLLMFGLVFPSEYMSAKVQSGTQQLNHGVRGLGLALQRIQSHVRVSSCHCGPEHDVSDS